MSQQEIADEVQQGLGDMEDRLHLLELNISTLVSVISGMEKQISSIHHMVQYQHDKGQQADPGTLRKPASGSNGPYPQWQNMSLNKGPTRQDVVDACVDAGIDPKKMLRDSHE